MVAESEDGKVVGFVMGELYVGEYGISRDGATIDTIGVDPQYHKKGIGKQLMSEFIAHLRDLGVKRINTLVDRNDAELIKFFQSNEFDSSKSMINLERSI